jgi:large subunit ribosomal protein L19e
MKLKVQKRLAADILKCSIKKIKIDQSRLEDIKESITKKDIRTLIKEGAVQKRKTQESSRGRTRKIKIQKSKGKRKGSGSRKGSPFARLPKKSRWASKIRTQRKHIKELRDNGKINKNTYSDLYMKSKGGFFRSKRHINLYLEEHDLIKNEKQ